MGVLLWLSCSLASVLAVVIDQDVGTREKRLPVEALLQAIREEWGLPTIRSIVWTVTP